MDAEPSRTDRELFARLESAAAGTFKLYSAKDAGIEERINQHLRNIDELHGRLRRAIDAGCHIETISLRLQIVDFWLRLYFVNKTPDNTKRRREFGALLKQCHQLGLDETLCQNLNEANARRIDAVHGFVVGSIGYEELAAVASKFGDLVKRTVEFVMRNCGTIVTSRDQLAVRPGACVVHVDRFCQEVLSGARY